MVTSRLGRSRPLCLAVGILHVCALLPDVVAAGDAAPANRDKPRLSQAEVIIGASSIGAGFALVLASYYVEDKHTEEIGFWAHDEYHGSVKIKSGSDTASMLIVGAGLLFLGAAVLAAPVGEDGDGDRDAASRSVREPGFQLQATALDGRSAAVAIAHRF